MLTMIATVQCRRQMAPAAEQLHARRARACRAAVYMIVVSPTFTTWLLVHATNCGVVFTGIGVVGQTT